MKLNIKIIKEKNEEECSMNKEIIINRDVKYN
jgi:hypothetical protein